MIKSQKDMAVSPVVGVMLMLVVVIIIAAVVSGFAGGLVKDAQSAPQLSMDVNIANNGFYSTSYFKAVVTSVSAPINTKDLKIVTAWTKAISGGNPIHGGATITPGVANFNVTYAAENGKPSVQWNSVSPIGDGPGVGVNWTESAYGKPYEGTANSMADIGGISGTATNYTWFGNYALQSGTTMFAQPFGGRYDDNINFTVGYGLGGTKYSYQYGTDSTYGATLSEYPNSVDQMQAVLGNNWQLLRPGDNVNVKVIHIPSGKTIWQGDVAVEGSVL
jgi:archaeal type IV pilus assembly protein PilA